MRLQDYLATNKMNSKTILKGNDCTYLFKQAYENRYTWGNDFSGYKGKCIMEYNKNIYEGQFVVDKDLKVIVRGINEEEIKKQIESQLWEVTIHRVRRSFESVHGSNTFTAGDINELGQEILIGGKNEGDKYRVKDNIINMVYRHIHGSLIRIYTTDIIDTGKGYLSKSYNSQYLDPSTKETKSPISYFNDQFSPINIDGTWILSKRIIGSKAIDNNPSDNKIFTFKDILVI